MATADLNNGTTDQIITGNDNIVIVNVFETIRGGRTLDVTGFPKENIHAGHVIIREDGTDNYKPMPLDAEGEEYSTLPESHSYAGILIASIPTNRAFAGIMVRGTVNHKAAPFDMATILGAVKSALPLINFTEDK